MTDHGKLGIADTTLHLLSYSKEKPVELIFSILRDDTKGECVSRTFRYGARPKSTGSPGHFYFAAPTEDASTWCFVGKYFGHGGNDSNRKGRAKIRAIFGI